MSIGLQWASTVTTIGLEMALPALLGAWLDDRYGTGPLWTVLLATLGFVTAMWHLWGMAKRLAGPGGRPNASPDPKDQGKPS
ncbi:MAG: AtpZ/AtpI family protein [Planctomycetaceae bacterium]